MVHTWNRIMRYLLGSDPQGTALYLLFGFLSILTVIFITVFVTVFYRKKNWKERTFPCLTVYTIGIFVAVLLFFLPITFRGSRSGGILFRLILTVLHALHRTMQVFILEGDFDTIRTELRALPEIFRPALVLHAAILYALSPVLTFTSVLSMFRNFRAKLYFRFFCKRRKLYIMSELSARSLALAHSILENTGNKWPRAKVIFTDVYPDTSETHHEFFADACGLRAVCLRQDVGTLDIISKKGDTEIFLLGENESENMEQTIQLLDQLNRKPTRQNVKLFTFATSVASSCILDSYPYEKLLDEAEKYNFSDRTFKLRRINVYQNLAWNLVPRMDLTGGSRGHVISVLITGLGCYGMEFFKAVLWYGQIEGYKLEINIIDSRKEDANGMGGVRSVLMRECPALLQCNPRTEDGNANYDIRYYEGIDLQTNDFSILLQTNSEARSRLNRTTHILVCTGEDDRNMETAIHLRMLFDRYHHVIADRNIRAEEEFPRIYAVVYHEKKLMMLSGDQKKSSEYLVNYKRIPYHINLVGSIRDQYAYSNIYQPELEAAAFRQHISWDVINRKAREALKPEENSLEKMIEYGISGSLDRKSECTEKRKYEKFEYYRNASISKELYARTMDAAGIGDHRAWCPQKKHEVICECQHCMRLKKSEHRRWIAYMMANGYSYDKNRADRAKYHPNLISSGKLSKWERAKDC